MANMYIHTYNKDYKGVVFDESHYLRYEHSTDFDMGTGDFSLGLVFYCDSTVGVKGSYKNLICNQDGSMDSDTGWMLSYAADNERLYFFINDGDASTSTAVTAASSFADDTYHYLWINVDRDAGVTFYKNGAAVTKDSDDTTNAQSSCTKSTPLLIGGFPGTNQFLKGYISSVHLCKGWLPSATWVQNWYYRMKTGHPRVNPIRDSIVWRFNQSLTAYHGMTIGGVTLSYNGEYCPTGAPSYTYHEPYSLEMTLANNPAYGFEDGYLPLDIVQRAYDGTVKYYDRGANKRRLYLAFTSNSTEQRYFVEGLWLAKYRIRVYLDADSDITMHGYMVSPPIIKEIAPGIYQYELELEEL